MNIVLIGYRGSGKSAVGRALADRLGWPLIDTDALIEQSAGMSIREIFERRGEASFRELESRAIADVARRDRQIISLGGGAILREENVAAVKSSGRLIWLTAPPEVLWERICRDTATRSSRPDLTPAGGLQEVRDVLSRRTPDYERAADIQVDTGGQSVVEIVDRVLHWLDLSETPDQLNGR